MDSPSENQPSDQFNKLDLSGLQNFQFGTQWSSTDSASSKDAAGRSRDDRGGDAGGQRRDRRQGRRPQGGSFDGPSGDAPRRQEFGGGEGGPRREFRERRGPPGAGGGQGGGPREGGFRGPGRFERGAPERQAGPPVPYESPFFDVTFYPDDVGFAALIKAMRSSGRTYELFQIANLLLEKNDRFVAVIKRRTQEGAAQPAAEGAAAEKRPLYVSVPDGVPFETEDTAVRHVLSKHLAVFFDTQETEVEPPKGNFPFVHKCPRTGELIGPPNYHRYSQLLQQHHAERVADMPFEMFRARLEAVREPEAIAAWTEKMKKATKYVAKIEVEGVFAQFTSRDDAVAFLTTRVRDKVVRESHQVRFPGKSFDSLPGGELRRAIDGALQRQRRFPLDTANALRGRLRREGLFLFKLPGKTITFVCAIKPRARRVGQVFSASIDPILTLIDNKPFVKLQEFERKILGLDTPPPAPAEGTPAGSEYTDEQKEQLVKALRDLRWLVHEGYLVEFADGRLYALPAASSEAKAQAAIEEVGVPQRREPSGEAHESHESGEHHGEPPPDLPSEPTS